MEEWQHRPRTGHLENRQSMSAHHNGRACLDVGEIPACQCSQLLVPPARWLRARPEPGNRGIASVCDCSRRQKCEVGVAFGMVEKAAVVGGTVFRHPVEMLAEASVEALDHAVGLRPAANGIEQKRSLTEFFRWYN